MIGQVPSLEAVADRLAIQEVLAVHCRGVDRADEAALKSAYWPDAQVAYGGFNGNAHEFCVGLPVGIKRYVLTQHSISNTCIELQDTNAKVETYVTAYHYLAGDDGKDTEMTYLGRYLDRFEKRDNCWKIKFRQVVMDWNQNTDASFVVTESLAGLARGSRFPDDVVYKMLDE